MGKFENTLICDVVYIDRMSNKAVLAGVYSGGVTLNEVPAIFRASIYSEYYPDVSGDLDLEFRVFVNGAHAGGAKMQIAGAVAGDVSVLVVPSFPIALSAPGTVVIKAFEPGKRSATILTKKVALTLPSASPPPS